MKQLLLRSKKCYSSNVFKLNTSTEHYNYIILMCWCFNPVHKTKYLELKNNDMVGGGSNNKFILVDGTSSAGKSTICKYFSKKNFLCFSNW